jgi:hypothetical protein
MAMAWISLGGFHPTKFGFLIVFLLLNVCALGQRVVGVQPGERLADAYFFLEDSMKLQKYFLELYFVFTI